MTNGATVYLVDDDPLSRRELIATLAAAGHEAWPFATAGQFTALLPQLQPAPILLGMHAPPAAAGVALLGELEAKGRRWPVVAFAAEPDTRTAVEAMKHGAIDYLPLPIAADALAEALAQAWDLLAIVEGEALARAEALERLEAVSPRERAVLDALVGGMGNKIAAHHLGLSVRTVEMHRSRLLRKLGVRTLPEAAVLLAQASVPAAQRRLCAMRLRGLGPASAAAH